MKKLLLLCALVLSFQEAGAQLSFVKVVKELTVSKMTADGRGGVVVAGTAEMISRPRLQGVQVARMTGNGELLWIKEIHAHENMTLSSLTSTSNGYYYGAGYIHGPQTQAFIFCLDSAGKLVWNKYYGYGTNWLTNSLLIYNIEAVGDDLYIFGNASVTTGNLPQGFVARLGHDGSIHWANWFYETWKWGVAGVDEQGNTILNNIEKLISISPAGSVNWARELKSPEKFEVQKITALQDGSAILTIYPSENNYGYMLLKVSKDGSLLKRSGIYVMARGPSITEHADGQLSMVLVRENFFGLGQHVILNTDLEPTEGYFLRDDSSNVSLGASDICKSQGRTYVLGHAFGAGTHITRLNDEHKINCAGMEEVLPTGESPAFSLENLTVTAKTFDLQPELLEMEVHDLVRKVETYCQVCNSIPFNLKDTALCNGEMLRLSAPADATQIMWSDGSTDTVLQVTASGQYWLKYKNECGMDAATDTVSITFSLPLPTQFSVSDTSVKPDDELQFYFDNSGLTYWQWDFGDSSTSTAINPVHRYSANGRYRVELYVENASGCKSVIEQEIDVFEYRLYMPNSFTPNSDVLNDAFGPEGIGIATYRLMIYNRWGELLFDGKDKKWDGQFKGKRVPEGVYLYRVDVQNTQGAKETRQALLNVMY